MPTPLRSLRIPDDVWRAAIDKASTEGTTVTAVVTKALQRYIRQPPPQPRA